MDFKFCQIFKNLPKIEAFHADFFGPKTSLDFPTLALALNCFLEYASATFLLLLPSLLFSEHPKKSEREKKKKKNK